MKKIILAVILVLVMSIIAAADSNEIVYNIGADSRTIDPALNNASDGAIVIMNTFDGLFRVGLDDKPIPACASHYEISDDGMTWTFHLRDNLKWSDGEKLTARHFKDGFMRFINPETGSPYANYGFFIKNAEKFYNGNALSEDVGIDVLDEKTLIIHLEYKNPLMLDYMAFPTFVPARMDIINKYQNAWAAKPETYISNGAFILESWKHGDGGEMTLVKNPNYWDADNVKVDRLRFVFINDSNTSLAAFRAGKLDLTSDVPLQMLPLLIKRGEIIPKPSLGVAYCEFNVNKKPFDDIRVRKAFALAIDRKIITDKILAEVLQGMWKKNLGIEVALLNEEWKVFLETRRNKDFDIARAAWILDFCDAANLLETLISDSAQNDTNYANPEFDDAMRKSAYEMDNAKRINFLHQAEKILMEDMPVIPIYFYSSGSLQSKRVKNIYKSPRGILLFRNAEVIPASMKNSLSD